VGGVWLGYYALKTVIPFTGRQRTFVRSRRAGQWEAGRVCRWSVKYRISAVVLVVTDWWEGTVCAAPTLCVPSLHDPLYWNERLPVVYDMFHSGLTQHGYHWHRENVHESLLPVRRDRGMERLVFMLTYW